MADSKIPSLQQRPCGYLRALNIGKWFLVPIAALCCLLWVFVIAASIFSAVYEKSASSRDDYPPIRWKDTLEDCDPGQIIWLFIPIAIETFHVPIQLWLYARNLLHPIAALVLSFCFMGLWVSFSVLAPLIDACVEQKFPDAWNGLFWARQVTGYLITLLYLAYFGFSCAAVHHWRSGKKAVDGTSSDGDIEMKA
ncbi:hypothetical protein H112_07136 [Trichophyton rubrum D6]|uniref:Uncharacterized protein n=3 Tax=Trichophyton rubrum TaxID=5551 RepID=F2SHB7_TRIRC|nr:uncharacterized protein TERG_02469 [Trichophyton rubrum CBS 118892]EZF11602.1 hypothetical protein H100_07161 [Trichophyton rubrum MR850]EZF38639.1 hypothetical protein H102_07121 [Trichophyton rubrum CBS 100081]EZF49263.1 hypothetical protein H103_07144 [Trichophyton rubrum CBS 288.86]EZF59891.1 hypothetical protein H104_07098 [Trichophyton rubrum CBS 289.86]EZF81239.1 hypothetical protein H110_07144 [Trichophyton rubrum MR1448]EZF91700.1 hypothetical protein H113_07197 [Trichophyton rubr